MSGDPVLCELSLGLGLGGAKGSWEPREAQNSVHPGDFSCLCVPHSIHCTPPAGLGCAGGAEMSV